MANVPKLKPLQVEVANKVFFEEGYNSHLYVAGRQSGKTYLVAWTCMMLLLYLVGKVEPKTKRMKKLVKTARGLGSKPVVSVIMPQYTQALSFGREALAPMMDDWRALPRCKDVIFTQERRSWGVMCRYGTQEAEITLHGLKDPQSLRGKTRTMLVVDEVADLDMRDIREVLLPMMKETGGFIFYTGTAKSNLSLTDLANYHEKTDGASLTVHSIYDELEAGQITQATLDAKIAEYPDGEEDYLFRQEYCADWTQAPEGAILKDWRMEVADPSYVEDAIDWAISMDIGFASKYVVMVWAIMGGGKVVLHDAREWKETMTADIIDEIARNNINRRIVVYVPHDAARRSGVAETTEKDAWRRATFASAVRDIPQKRGATRISREESIRMTRVRLNDVLICKAMLENRVVDYARNCKFKDGSEDLDKDNVHDHALDAFRYGIQGMELTGMFDMEKSDEEPGWLKYHRMMERRLSPVEASMRHELEQGSITEL